MYNNVKIEINQGVATLTVNRPDAMNALNNDVLNDLYDAFTELRNDESVLAIIVTGEGKAFVAGADIAAMYEMNPLAAKALSANGHRVMNYIEATPKPVIAGADTLFLGNIRRFGQFEQRCSLCGECIVTETAGICPVTACAKGLLNGPCGGMSEGKCETDPHADCAWVQIIQRLEERGDTARAPDGADPKDYSAMLKPGKLTLER